MEPGSPPTQSGPIGNKRVGLALRQDESPSSGAQRVLRALLDPALRAISSPTRWSLIGRFVEKLCPTPRKGTVDPNMVKVLGLQVEALKFKIKDLESAAKEPAAVNVSVLIQQGGSAAPQEKEEEKPPPTRKMLARRRLSEAALKEVARPAKRARRDNLGRLHVE